MDIDVSIGRESVTINIENPYRFDMSQIMKAIVDFGLNLGGVITLNSSYKSINKERGFLSGKTSLP